MRKVVDEGVREYRKKGMALRSLRFNNVENGKEEWYPRVMLGAELLGPGPYPFSWWVRGFQACRSVLGCSARRMLDVGIDGVREVTMIKRE